MITISVDFNIISNYFKTVNDYCTVIRDQYKIIRDYFTVVIRGVQQAGSVRSGQNLNGRGWGGSCQILNGSGRVKAGLNPTHFDPFFKS